MREDVYKSVSAYAASALAKKECADGEWKRYLEHVLRDFRRAGNEHEDDEEDDGDGGPAAGTDGPGRLCACGRWPCATLCRAILE